MKQEFKSKLVHFISSFGYHISKIEKTKFEMLKINNINDPIKRLNLLENWYNQLCRDRLERIQQ
jgi:hypothetical protein